MADAQGDHKELGIMMDTALPSQYFSFADKS